jgi:4-amino-4-deoxy-L-arabinose transferase-like glycosyltransferase
VFSVFGPDNYRGVLLVQAVVDLVTCFLIADMARRTISDRGAKIAFLLAAICPFLADYCAAALTETLEIFFTAAALDLLIAALAGLDQRRLLRWIGCGAMISGAILLRPDGGILLASIGIYLGYVLIYRKRANQRLTTLITGGLLLALAALTPLLPWTLRNLHTLHRFQPLAPRYANEVGEFVPMGFNRWTKTWMAEFASVQEIYWNVPGDAVDAGKLPSRAFDSPDEKQKTLELFAIYNQDHDMTPELDAAFGSLAQERIRAHPLRYYLWLPILRITDMWLRPRTELLPADPRWWEFNDERRWSVVSLLFGAINLVYVVAALVGVIRADVAWAGLLFCFILVRSIFLGSLENPEPRYTLECFPALLVFAAAACTAVARARVVTRSQSTEIGIQAP